MKFYRYMNEKQHSYKRIIKTFLQMPYKNDKSSAEKPDTLKRKLV